MKPPCMDFKTYHLRSSCQQMFESIVTNIGHNSSFLAGKALTIVEIRMAYFLVVMPRPLNILHAPSPTLKVLMATDEPFFAYLGEKASMASFIVHSQIIAPLSNNLYISVSWVA